jgi:hypothetical protein
MKRQELIEELNDIYRKMEALEETMFCDTYEANRNNYNKLAAIIDNLENEEDEASEA